MYYSIAMDEPTNRLEVEIKYRLSGAADHERLRQRLTALGAQPSPVQREENVLFDSQRGDLRQRQALLRVRRINGELGGTLTFKGPPAQTDGVKAREEIEVVIEDAAALQVLLAALGYTPVNGYRKWRETWYLDTVEVLLDTVSMGYFCEIEGPHAKILALGRRLGLSDEQVETAGYAELTTQAAGVGATGQSASTPSPPPC